MLHIKRAVFQGGHCWGNLNQTSHESPSPEECGRKEDKDGSWTPLWTQLPDASKSSRKLIKCVTKAAKDDARVFWQSLNAPLCANAMEIAAHKFKTL